MPRWVASCALGVLFTLGGVLPARLEATPPLTQAQQIAIIRALVAEVGIARQALPPDKHGVVISPDGQILNPGSVQSALEDRGDSAQIGDRVAITAIDFKSNHIVFTINGGPHRTHWYNHVHIGLGGTMPASTTTPVGPHGSMITLKFPHDVPALTPEQVKQDLSPLIDWDRPSKAEVMVQPLPAPVKEAIAQHQALVGMTKQMVVAALGRTNDKSGETDGQGRQVEDWVYGNPPETTFVRFYNNRVLRVTIWRHGVATVSTEAPPALAAALKRQQEQASELNQEASQPAPTLRRPGDAPPPKLQPGNAAPPPLNMPQGPASTGASPQNPTNPPQTPPVVCCRG
ncbi:MAG: hypothetical protein ACRD1C_04955 [Terriglobales bacterium]